ncbi:tyrosine-type recombinase/integrase, partial [bacterium]|nr:tyrosine-type recombinase/integrase [bacterium]
MRQNGDKERKFKPAKNATINRELAIVSRAFTLGQQCEKIQFKPHVVTLRENNVRTGFFEADQFESFCKYLPDDLKAPVIFAYCTGWRLGEVFTREWQHVDFKSKVVRLEPGETKNGKGRMFPLTPQLLQLLKEQK